MRGLVDSDFGLDEAGRLILINTLSQVQLEEYRQLNNSLNNFPPNTIEFRRLRRTKGTKNQQDNEFELVCKAGALTN